ncbi:MAG: hypothetical protein IJU57_04335 [Clostridia bacterium]|nr:hypothetical protein [Clostridia bacterium]
MILDEQDLREGLKFIVGTWQAEFVVSLFSNDLAHIPASEFKTNEGTDFSGVTFRFYEDHTLEFCFGEKRSSGTWEQTDWGTYRYSLEDLVQIPEGAFKDSVETLQVLDGKLCFSIGFLTIGMEKTEEGTVTEPEKRPDIGDMESSPEDLAMTDIVGTYKVAESMAFIDGDFKLFPVEVILDDLKKKLDSGDIDEEEYNDSMKGTELIVEFTPEHTVLQWMKLPEGISEEEIKAALEEGEIKAVKDGMFAAGENEWKALGGKYYFNSNESRELFGEEQSPWDELTFDDNGCMNFASGMMKIRKI